MEIIKVNDDYKVRGKLYIGNKEVALKDIRDIKTRIIPKLKETVKGKGVGLAAPQVGINLRLFVIHNGLKWKAFVNPEIVSMSEETETERESCLSVPYIECEVERSREVEVKYLDVDKMKLVTVNLSGVVARRFQHEYDHLLGKLITDKAKAIYSKETGNLINDYSDEYKED